MSREGEGEGEGEGGVVLADIFVLVCLFCSLFSLRFLLNFFLFCASQKKPKKPGKNTSNLPV